MSERVTEAQLKGRGRPGGVRRPADAKWHLDRQDRADQHSPAGRRATSRLAGTGSPLASPTQGALSPGRLSTHRGPDS